MSKRKHVVDLEVTYLDYEDRSLRQEYNNRLTSDTVPYDNREVKVKLTVLTVEGGEVVDVDGSIYYAKVRVYFDGEDHCWDKHKRERVLLDMINDAVEGGYVTELMEEVEEHLPRAYLGPLPEKDRIDISLNKEEFNLLLATGGEAIQALLASKCVSLGDLVFSDSEAVRATVAMQGYGFPILAVDDSSLVRGTVDYMRKKAQR